MNKVQRGHRDELILKLLKQNMSPSIIATRADTSQQTVTNVKKKYAEEFGFSLREGRAKKELP